MEATRRRKFPNRANLVVASTPLMLVLSSLPYIVSRTSKLLVFPVMLVSAWKILYVQGLGMVSDMHPVLRLALPTPDGLHGVGAIGDGGDRHIQPS